MCQEMASVVGDTSWLVTSELGQWVEGRRTQDLAPYFMLTVSRKQELPPFSPPSFIKTHTLFLSQFFLLLTSFAIMSSDNS